MWERGAGTSKIVTGETLASLELTPSTVDEQGSLRQCTARFSRNSLQSRLGSCVLTGLQDRMRRGGAFCWPEGRVHALTRSLTAATQHTRSCHSNARRNPVRHVEMKIQNRCARQTCKTMMPEGCLSCSTVRRTNGMLEANRPLEVRRRHRHRQLHTPRTHIAHDTLVYQENLAPSHTGTRKQNVNQRKWSGSSIPFDA